MSNEKKQNAVVKKEITESVLAKVNQFEETGQLVLPKDYSAANALKGAMLYLQEAVDKNKKPVLEVCTRESIANSLLKMVTEGLSVLKSQGYFIPYGSKLTWMRSYQGSIALAKRTADVKEVNANAIYKGDEFNYEVDTDTGRMKLIKHTQKLENIKNEAIIGGYAIVVYNDGTKDLEVMTIAEIEQAWSQGYGKGDTHKKFTQEMAKKTVIHRACKGPINSSTDANLNLSDRDDDNTDSFTKEHQELSNNNDVEDVDFEEAVEVKNEPKEQPKEDKKPKEVKEEKKKTSSGPAETKNELNF